MLKNLELRDVSSSLSTSKKLNRCRSFHFRYLELCRSKNLTPQADIRAKNNATSLLDFFGDKLGVNDWLLIVEALYYDQVLQTLGIRLRKSLGTVLDHLDTEKKAKLFKQKPVICTKFVFTGVVEAVSNCIQFNKNLKILCLEGLPLNDKYVDAIAKALSYNESIKEISFQRSNIYDKGCEAICNTIKYLEHIEKLDLSECELTTTGAEYVADMIKIQKISRYTEGWQKSLRYRDFDPDTILGLRSIALARNPLIVDDGLKAIAEVLKEDCWVKIVDMENCGLTDRAANVILDCLEVNHCLIEFNVRGNNGISKFLQRSIRDHLGKDGDEHRTLEAHQQINSNANGQNAGAKKTKVTVPQLKEQLKTLEEQLTFERVLRKKAELLNEKLNMQIVAFESRLENQANAGIPEGYVVVKNESLQSIIRERNDYQKQATNIPTDPPCNINVNINRPKQLNAHPTSIVYDDVTVVPPATSNSASIMLKEPRRTLQVRKVKSEMKYLEPVRHSSKKKESKSDHEFANEIDFQLATVHIETNIGDSAEVSKISNIQQALHQVVSGVAPPTGPAHPTPQSTSRMEKKSICTKFEMDDLSISSSRSITSEAGSSDSDTLRNKIDDYQPLKVFIRRGGKQPQEYAQDKGIINSPRSVFLGLCDDE